jgi:hypothetical protein
LHKTGSENAHRCAQNTASALALLEQYHKNGNNFFNNTVRVTHNETLVSFVNVEIKEQPKKWMHTHTHQ